MGLEPIEMKSKRLSTIGCGTHLCMILDMYYLTNAAKEYILIEGKHKVMVVLFASDWKKGQEKKIHEHHYVIDGGWRQDKFKQLISAAQVVSSVEGQGPTKKDAIGKRLWLSLKETHTIDDGKPVLNENNEPTIEVSIFKMTPYIDNVAKPKIAGDPADNNGIPSGEFIDWINIGINAKPKAVEAPIQNQMPQQPIDLDEVPQF